MDWVPGQPVRLETTNYIIRSLMPEDITADYVSWWSDSEVMEGVARPMEPRPKQMHQRRVVNQFDNRKSFHLGIFEKQMNLLLGFISIFTSPFHLTATTNTIIGNRAYWGRGLVLECRGRVLDFIFDDLQMVKVSGKPIARNAPSVFNYKAQGFKTEGVLRKEWRYEDGRRVDVAVFGLFRDEWQAHKANQEQAS